jgi:pimeloyl-ACP methyl ester carboxylesterase
MRLEDDNELRESTVPTVRANGANLAYEILGDRGVPIALTSGAQNNRDAMRPIAKKLASDYRVLIWDRRNCGDSDLYVDPEPDEIETWAADLHRLLQALNMLPAYIGGSSAGTLTTLRLMRKHPDSAKGLLLLNPPVENPEGIRDVCRTGFLELAEVSEQAGMAAVVEMGWVASLVEVSPPQRRRLLEVDPLGFAAALRAWATALETPGTYWGLTETELRAIEIPVLVFSNENRWTHPWSAVEMLCDLLPHATTPSLAEAEIIEIKRLAKKGNPDRYQSAMAEACDKFIRRHETAT